MKREWLLNILTVLVVGISGYTLKEVHAQSKSLAVTTQVVLDGKESRLRAESQNASAHDRIEVAMREVVSKREFDSRIADINTQLQDIRTRVLNLEVQIAKFQKP